MIMNVKIIKSAIALQHHLSNAMIIIISIIIDFDCNRRYFLSPTRLLFKEMASTGQLSTLEKKKQ